MEGLQDRKRAAGQLESLLREQDGHLTTGFVGTPFLCRVLCENGMADKAYRLLLDEDYPGWLYEVNLGATTIWERWNSLDAAGHISGTGMNSLNHYAYGAVVGWLFRCGAGLYPDPGEPGFRRVKIAPKVSFRLRSLRAEFESAAGKYGISWEIPDNCHIRLRVSVPAGCTALVVLPFAGNERTVTVSGGVMEEFYETERPLTRSLSVREKLGILMEEWAARKFLYSQIAELDYLLTFTRDYPLLETLENLGYAKEKIREIGRGLSEILTGNEESA